VAFFFSGTPSRHTSVFKNLTVYRMGPGWSFDRAALESTLAKTAFVPCGASQQRSSGWAPPRGQAHSPFVEVIDGQVLLQLQSEQRVVPGSVVKRRTEEMAEHIEQQSGRKPGKKQMKELKEQALHELLPMAFTKQSSTRVWLSPKAQMLMLDTASQARCDEVVTLLIQAIDGLVLSLVHTEMSPAMAMAHWLGSGEAPYQFSVDRECELKSADEMKSVVRYARHPLDTDEVKQHILTGKVPTRLALTWRDRVSFMLTESLQLKKLAFLDLVFEGAGLAASKTEQEEAFDANAAITMGEMMDLIPDLIEALGGESATLGGAPKAAPVQPPATVQPQPVLDTEAPW
jgi:recombination associated protein RdgC